MADPPAEPPALARAAAAARGCTRCPALVAARTRVVWGGGAPRADVLLVGEAPGAREDELDAPLTGRARRALDAALAAAGLGPQDTWLTGLVKCRTPGNRPAAPAEVAACHGHLVAAAELVGPVVVVALGGEVTRALRGRAGAIRELRGREEPLLLGGLAVWLLPVFHPAAAAYAPALEAQLRADLAGLPALVARGRPGFEPAPAAAPEAAAAVEPGQLELF